MTVFAEPLVSETWKLRMDTPVVFSTAIELVNVPDTTSAKTRAAIAMNETKYLKNCFIVF
jgi:hypothetical protein